MVKCPKCGNPDVWDDRYRRRECCRVVRMMDNERQMREKKGPLWDKRVKAHKAAEEKKRKLRREMFG